MNFFKEQISKPHLLPFQMFSTLQIFDPSPEEIEVAEKGITKLELMWRKLDLSITPKYHVLFTHTIKQVRKYNGISVLVEDFIE